MTVPSKPRKALSILAALGLGAALAAVMAWYYDLYVHWLPRTFSFTITAVIVETLLLALIALLTLLVLRMRGEPRPALAWKTALSAGAFIAVNLAGAFIVIRYVMRGGAARQAACVALLLAAAQVLALLILFFQALLRKGGRAYKACVIASWAAGALALGIAAANFGPTTIDGGVHAAEGRYAYTFAYSTEKVKREQILGRRETLRVTMGKNEREGVQFILRQRFDGGHIFTFSMSDVVGENGDAIPATVYQESYTFAGTGRDKGLYPDALVKYNGEIVSAPKRMNQGFYIELRTGKDTPPGVYSATVAVKDAEKGEVSFSAPFTVEVVDVAFPDAAYNDSAVGLGGVGNALNGAEPGTPEADALYKQYYDYLLDHKISAYDLPYDILDPQADAYMGDPRVKSFLIPYPEDDARLQAYYQKVQSNPDWARKGYFYPIDEPGNAEAIDRYDAMTERLARLCPGYHMVTPFCAWQFSEGGAGYDNLAIQDGRSDIICPISNLYSKHGFPEGVRRR
ncbi:MAG: hypothetical protein LBB75_03920, partial [Oscillospiraceae bacterium]|nr:hypothetical protein [Oscillospiraceae bacterium]